MQSPAVNIVNLDLVDWHVAHQVWYPTKTVEQRNAFMNEPVRLQQ